MDQPIRPRNRPDHHPARALVLCCLLYMLLSWIPEAVSASSGPDPDLPPSISGQPPLSVGRLIAAANLAHQRGDRETAERTWAQARAQWPALPEPTWRRPPKVTFEAPPSSNLKQTLEERLRRNPADTSTRRQLLEIAETTGDTMEILRHRSLIASTTDHETHVPSFPQTLLLVILVGLVAWQGWKLLCELLSTR